MQLGCCFTRKVYPSRMRMVYFCVIPCLWSVLCCLFTPGLYGNGTGRSTWLTGLRWAIPLCYNLTMSRKGQTFIQTIFSGFKPKPTTLLFWKGLDVFILSDTAKQQIEVVSLPFSAVSCDPAGDPLCQCEHNMTEFIFKSLTSQCHRHAPCCAGSHCWNRRCLLQNWSLANIPVFVLGREAWTKLYGKCSFTGFKKSHWLGMFSHDVMICNGTFILAKPSSLRSGFSSVVCYKQCLSKYIVLRV